MKRHIAILSVILILTGLTLSGCSGTPGREDSGEKAAVKKYNATFAGRFDFSDQYGPVYGWPGSSIKARFKGTGLKMKIRPVNPSERDNWLNVIIDGQEPVPIRVDRKSVV